MLSRIDLPGASFRELPQRGEQRALLGRGQFVDALEPNLLRCVKRAGVGFGVGFVSGAVLVPYARCVTELAVHGIIANPTIPIAELGFMMRLGAYSAGTLGAALGIFWSKLPGSVRNADNVDITLAMGVLCGVMVPLAGDLLGLFTWIMLPDMLRPENPEPWLRIIRGTVIVASIIAGVTRGFNES